MVTPPLPCTPIMSFVFLTYSPGLAPFAPTPRLATLPLPNSLPYSRRALRRLCHLAPTVLSLPFPRVGTTRFCMLSSAILG